FISGDGRFFHKYHCDFYSFHFDERRCRRLFQCTYQHDDHNIGLFIFCNMDWIARYLSAFFKEKENEERALRQAQGDNRKGSSPGLGEMVYPAAMDQLYFCGMFDCGDSPDSSTFTNRVSS